MLLLLLPLLLLLLTCQKALCTRWLCLFNFIVKNLSLTLQKDDREGDKEERGKEREGDLLAPGEEEKIPQDDPQEPRSGKDGD